MMLSIEKRGKHATGIAVDGGDQPLIWKSATTVSTVLKSDPWNKIMEAINTDDTIILGHTRHASQPNSGLDEAAHPFQIGEIIGAHNGMIFNWHDIEKELKPEKPWIVDSQAIFALLDVAKKPIAALQELEGYFALEWTRRKQLYLARSASGVLACAYVYPQRTLYWHSEGEELRKILNSYGLTQSTEDNDGKDYKVWNTNPNCIYRYDPKKFTLTSAHAEKYTGDFSTRQRKEKKSPTGTQMTFPLKDVLTPTSVQSSKYTSQDYEPPYGKRLRIRIEELERQVDSIFSFLESKGLLDEFEEHSGDTHYVPDECEYCGNPIHSLEQTVDGTNGGRVHAWHLADENA